MAKDTFLVKLDWESLSDLIEHGRVTLAAPFGASGKYVLRLKEPESKEDFEHLVAVQSALEDMVADRDDDISDDVEDPDDYDDEEEDEEDGDEEEEEDDEEKGSEK